MSNLVHLSVQFVPVANKEEAYVLIDRAIEVFRLKKVLKQVTPLESILEGTYKELMLALSEAKDACLQNQGQELIINLRIHMAKGKDVSWEEKTAKHQGK